MNKQFGSGSPAQGWYLNGIWQYENRIFQPLIWNGEKHWITSYLKFSFLKTLVHGIEDDGSLKILIFRNFPQISLVSTLNWIASGYPHYPVIMIFNTAVMALVEPVRCTLTSSRNLKYLWNSFWRPDEKSFFQLSNL